MLIGTTAGRSQPEKVFGPNHHFAELDGLRGLAALAVMCGHILDMFPETDTPGTIGRVHSGLVSLFAGPEPILLYVLSGFVLSLPFLKGSRGDFVPFVIRRFFRLYVPYIVAIAVSLACCAWVYRGPNTHLSGWFNMAWAPGITASAVTDHLLLIGRFDTTRFDPVLWSLVYKIRISLVFPLLAAVLLRLSWRTSLALACACSLTGVLGALATSQEVEWGTGYLPTFHYAGLFIVGFLLAQNINRIHAACARLSSTTKACLALAAFTVYTCGHLLPGRLYSFSHLPIALGAVMLLVTGVCSRRTSAFMKLKPLAFLGDIAYGVYLYHVIVLLTLVHLLYGRLHMGWILTLTAGLTVGMAYLSRTLVELPCVRIGRQVARMYQLKVGVIRQQPASIMTQNSQSSVLGSPA